jgi:hypothetical protein
VTGPRMMLIPATPDQTPIALVRSAPLKMLVVIERVDGMISAPPIPISARAAIRYAVVPDQAAQIDAPPKMTRPSVSARFRPKRSPRLPVVSRRPAKTST